MDTKNKYSGTQTEKNLMAAFSGESQARNKYTYFASVAKKQGFEQIAALFLKTADNEKEHAKLWLKELCGIGDTAENLAAAADGENYEWTDMYEGFAKTAEEEGCRTCGKIPPRSRNRKAPRRALPRTASQCGSRRGFRQKRSKSMGMPQLRTYSSRSKCPGGMPDM